MPQLLCCNWTNKGGTTQIQPYRNNNGTLTAFGNPYTPTNLHADTNTIKKTNWVVQFGDYFYCCAGGELRVYNPATTNWDLEYVPAMNEEGAIGLYSCKDSSGNLQLSHVYVFASGATLRFRTLSTPGGTWSAEVNTAVALSVWNPGYEPIKDNNRLFLTYLGSAVVLDLAAGTAVRQTVNGTTGQAATIASSGDRIFFFCHSSNTATAYVDVYEYIAGSFTLILSGATAAISGRRGGATACNNMIFFWDEDAGVFVGIMYQDSVTAAGTNLGGDGIHAWTLDIDTLTETDVTNPVVPASLRGPSATNPLADIRWTIEVDTETDPTSPVTYLWCLVADGIWQRYQYNGLAAPLTLLGTFGTRAYVLPCNPQGGGEYHFGGSTTANPGYHIEEVQARDQLSNATRIYFRGSLIDETGGSPTPPDKEVGLYFGRLRDRTAHRLCTIANVAKVSGPGSTPSIVSGKIQNVTFDSTSIYSVEWQAVADGLSDQQKHKFMLHVTT